MQNLLIFSYIFISIVLIVMILLQQSKGSDIGSAFGGGASNTQFGPDRSLSPLAKITAFLAMRFLIVSLAITLQLRSSDEDFVIADDLVTPTEEGVLPDTMPD